MMDRTAGRQTFG